MTTNIVQKAQENKENQQPVVAQAASNSALVSQSSTTNNVVPSQAKVGVEAPKKSFCGRLFSLKTVGYTALAVSVAAIAVLSKMAYDHCPRQGLNLQSAEICFDTLRNVTAPIVHSVLQAIHLG